MMRANGEGVEGPRDDIKSVQRERLLLLLKETSYREEKVPKGTQLKGSR